MKILALILCTFISSHCSYGQKTDEIRIKKYEDKTNLLGKFAAQMVVYQGKTLGLTGTDWYNFSANGDYEFTSKNRKIEYGKWMIRDSILFLYIRKFSKGGNCEFCLIDSQGITKLNQGSFKIQKEYKGSCLELHFFRIK